MYLLKRELRLNEDQKILIRNKVFLLPKKERDTIELYFWQEYSHLKIAQILNVQVSDVSELIKSALSKLRGDFLGIASEYFEMYSPSNNYKNYRR